MTKVKKKMKYYFSTTPRFKNDIAKSPIGMFKTADNKWMKEIPNDLGFVKRKLVEYYIGKSSK